VKPKRTGQNRFWGNDDGTGCGFEFLGSAIVHPVLDSVL